MFCAWEKAEQEGLGPAMPFKPNARRERPSINRGRRPPGGIGFDFLEAKP